jgi:hypothetical protein
MKILNYVQFIDSAILLSKLGYIIIIPDKKKRRLNSLTHVKRVKN